jgi:hypothetical protein
MAGRSAAIIGKILKGSNPADLPVEQATSTARRIFNHLCKTTFATVSALFRPDVGIRRRLFARVDRTSSRTTSRSVNDVSLSASAAATVSLHPLLQRRGDVTETFHRRYGLLRARSLIAILSPADFDLRDKPPPSLSVHRVPVKHELLSGIRRRWARGPKLAGQLERSSDGSSGWSRIGSKGVRSVLRAAPSAISSARASPVAGALRMPQTLWPVAT